MERITIAIERADVFREAAQVTDYIGSLRVYEDPEARERLLLTDAAAEESDRIWGEAVAGANDGLRDFLVADQSDGERYSAELEVSRMFRRAVLPSVRQCLTSYFVSAIAGQWFGLVSPEQAAEHCTAASEFINSAVRLLYSRRRPELSDFKKG